MSFFDKLLRKNKKYLKTEEHFRAFSPDPDADYYQLSNNKDNSEAISYLKGAPINLQHVSTGQTVTLSNLTQSNIIFLTIWEPYSALSIGSIKRKIDASEISNCVFVLFEEDIDSIKGSKSKAWYFELSYVLHPDSKQLIEHIGRVPLIITTDKDGNISNTAACIIK